MDTTFPEIVLPDWLTLLVTITPMNDGNGPGGADELLPEPAVHVPPQDGGVVLVVAAKPLNADGAAPPLSLLRVDHCAHRRPHNVR